MKRKSNVTETENGTTAVVSFAAANVHDTCLGFRVICETVTNKNSVEECVSHNSSFWRKGVATEFNQEWLNIVKHNTINDFIKMYSYVFTFNDMFLL